MILFLATTSGTWNIVLDTLVIVGIYASSLISKGKFSTSRQYIYYTYVWSIPPIIVKKLIPTINFTNWFFSLTECYIGVVQWGKVWCGMMW